jgi:hypothetical protein
MCSEGKFVMRFQSQEWRPAPRCYRRPDAMSCELALSRKTDRITASMLHAILLIIVSGMIGGVAMLEIARMHA